MRTISRNCVRLAVMTMVTASLVALTTTSASSRRERPPVLPGAVLATEATTIVVDDDGVQCGNAGFGSIGAAVAAANPGDTVRVCPGIYRERVVVDKPLRLIGDREAVESVGCFEDTWSIADVIDPTVFPVIEPPDAEIGSLVQLQADGIELAGLVAQGQRETTTGKTVFAPAIRADGANAGHWIHHNLVQNNTFGIELGSNGTTLSRVDHNCLRGNDWALANQRYTTGSVRVDHNDVYNTRVIPFEVGTYAGGISDARFDHNRSVGSGYAAYLVEKATSVHLDHNTVDGAVMSGVVVRGDNRSVEISDNQLSGTTTALGGISLATPGPQAPTPSTDLLLQRNSVEHFNIGILLGGGSATADTRIIENVTRDNRVSGIQIGATNTSALVQGNVSDHNAYGIRTASPLVMGHSFLGNSMHLNTVTDAVEASFTTVGDVTTLNNIWLDNLCDTDSPNGTICVN